MSDNSLLVLLAGLGSAFIAIVIVMLAALMYTFEVLWPSSLFMASTAAFPADIAVSLPTASCHLNVPLAIRIMGGVVCLMLITGLALSFLGEKPPKEKKALSRVGIIGLMIASGTNGHKRELARRRKEHRIK